MFETFSAISSVILFAISIITFISSMITKAQSDGKFLARIEQIQGDIVEIKTTLKERGKDAQDQRIAFERQDERIRQIENSCNKLDERLSKVEEKI